MHSDDQVAYEEAERQSEGRVTEGGRIYRHLVQTAAAGGEPWAQAIEESCISDGFRRRFRILQRRMGGRVLIRTGGALAAVARVVGVKLRNDTGLPTGERQGQFWHYLPWVKIEEALEEAVKHMGQMGAKVEGYQKALALRERAPRAANPDEAATMLGINLEEYLAS